MGACNLFVPSFCALSKLSPSSSSPPAHHLPPVYICMQLGGTMGGWNSPAHMDSVQLVSVWAGFSGSFNHIQRLLLWDDALKWWKLNLHCKSLAVKFPDRYRQITVIHYNTKLHVINCIRADSNSNVMVTFVLYWFHCNIQFNWLHQLIAQFSSF